MWNRESEPIEHNLTDAGHIWVSVHAHLDEETGQYESHCPELGVSSCGESVEEALAMLDDAIALYLTALEEEGDWVRVLAARGIEVRPGPPTQLGLSVMARPDGLGPFKPVITMRQMSRTPTRMSST